MPCRAQTEAPAALHVVGIPRGRATSSGLAEGLARRRPHSAGAAHRKQRITVPPCQVLTCTELATGAFSCSVGGRTSSTTQPSFWRPATSPALMLRTWTRRSARNGGAGWGCGRGSGPGSERRAARGVRTLGALPSPTQANPTVPSDWSKHAATAGRAGSATQRSWREAVARDSPARRALGSPGAPAASHRRPPGPS